MVAETVISMVSALVIIAIILVSGGARMYFRHKYDVTEHFKDIDAATARQNIAKTRLHNVQQIQK
jgi:hypothetical protein